MPDPGDLDLFRQEKENLLQQGSKGRYGEDGARLPLALLKVRAKDGNGPLLEQGISSHEGCRVVEGGTGEGWELE